jgi:predicted nucleotidyltransferase
MSKSELAVLVQGAAEALKAAGAREVYVFGSAAKGTLREDSDIDLAVSGLPPEVFSRAMARASRPVGRPVGLINLDRDNPFTRYLKEEGELQRVG